MPRDDATDEGKVQVVGKACESPASRSKTTDFAESLMALQDSVTV